MSSDSSPLLGIRWDRGAADGAASGDLVAPEDQNRVARYLERLARVLLYRLVEDGVINSTSDVPTVDESTARIATPPAGNPIQGTLYGRLFRMTDAMEATGTVDSGDTTYIRDTARTEDSNFWLDAFIIFTSGANSGEVRQITGFDLTTHQLTWLVPLPSSPSAGDDYSVTFYHIQDKTNGATNYVYGRALSRTARDAVIQWVANTTGDKTAGDILVATMDLDAGGNVTSSDNAPTDHDRNLWAGVGAVHQIVLSGTLLSLPGGSYVDVVLSHSALILLGPIEVFVDDADCEITVLQWYEPDSLTIRVTNNSAYSTDVSYEVTRWGRKKVYL